MGGIKEELQNIQGNLDWDSWKSRAFDGKTLEQTWNEVKDVTTDLFDQGCKKLGGESDEGCCQIRNLIKCNTKAIKEKFDDIKEETIETFKKGCEEVGGTVSGNTCTAEGNTVTNAFQSAAGAAQTNIIPMIVMLLLMMFLSKMVFTRMN